MQTGFIPNFFILGAAKCGTTTLHKHMELIPGVCMSNPKEPFFFEAEFHRGIDYYREKYFSHWSGEPIIGEARHRNLYLPYVPRRIYGTNPHSRMVVILRDPVDRAYSHWRHLSNTKMERCSFRRAVEEDMRRIDSGLLMNTPEEIESHVSQLFDETTNERHGLGCYRTYIDTGHYAEQIARYFEIFGRDKVRVIFFEEFTRSARDTLAGLADFLGVSSAAMHIDEGLHLNSAADVVQSTRNNRPSSLLTRAAEKVGRALKGRRTLDEPPEQTKEWLTNYYRPHVRRLEELIGRSTPWSAY